MRQYNHSDILLHLKPSIITMFLSYSSFTPIDQTASPIQLFNLISMDLGLYIMVKV